MDGFNVGQKDIVLACREIHHWFGENRVLHDVNIEIERGAIVGLVGPSGCGKSTLLRAIVGTHPPNQGEVIVVGRGTRVEKTVERPGRDRGIVYQRYSLFPFLTAQENVALGLMLDQTTIPFRLFNFSTWRKLRRQHLDEAAVLLEQLHLGKSLKRYPHELSGGMRQRVAIAQALIMKPEILLLDEPFGALDEATRADLQLMLLDLYQENLIAREQGKQPPYTIMMVTHELSEAIYVGDRVLGLSQYWNWKEAGHQICPGATIVYDQAAPISRPGEIKNPQSSEKQLSDIRRIVFDPTPAQDPKLGRN